MTMIDTTLLLPAELGALTMLAGLGLWLLYRRWHSSAPVVASTPHAFDMRVDGQQLSMLGDY